MKLLVKDRKGRLGAKEDIKEIMEHPWFADVDQRRILCKAEPAPKL